MDTAREVLENFTPKNFIAWLDNDGWESILPMFGIDITADVWVTQGFTAHKLPPAWVFSAFVKSIVSVESDPYIFDRFGFIVCSLEDKPYPNSTVVLLAPWCGTLLDYTAGISKNFCIGEFAPDRIPWLSTPIL